ncbi:uncharacterized protein LOC142541743 [Primulina tabacum]|uniref:uncharacterized protein LOC142541743 n=1 Tax=Primulina tabacum TaxID=48773 RepID=UPI003F5AD417
MRIRKHAKISPLLYATSPQDTVTLPQAHICQLNQSPWDVMNFSLPRPCPPPTPPSQVYGNDCFAGNGSSRDSIAVTRREWSISDGAAPDDTEQEACTSPKDNSIILCCKTDSTCWQCGREAAKGNSLCEHHLLMLRNYSNYNSAHSATKNSEKSSVETQGRRPRSKKRAATIFVKSK